MKWYMHTDFENSKRKKIKFSREIRPLKWQNMIFQKIFISYKDKIQKLP